VPESNLSARSGREYPPLKHLINATVDSFLPVSSKALLRSISRRTESRCVSSSLGIQRVKKFFRFIFERSVSQS